MNDKMFRNTSLSSAVHVSVDEYLTAMEGEDVNDLYELVLSEVEAPMLQRVLDFTGNNQSATATMLGLNRTTLRKKLRKYGLL